jgi:hypothetical protein
MVGKGRRTGPGRTQRGRSVLEAEVPEEERIDWREADLSALESAMAREKPIVLFFMEEGMEVLEGSFEIHCAELAKIADDRQATFLLVEHNGDRTPSLDDGSPIPTSRLLSPNMGRDYDIRRYPTVVVCDHFGNEYQNFNRIPQPRQLKSAIESVADQMEDMNRRLMRDVEAAEKALEEKNLRAFFTASTRLFRTGTVGLEAAEKMASMYREVIDEQRKEIDKILDERPEDALQRLRDMSRNFRNTELADEIEEATAIIRGR